MCNKVYIASVTPLPGRFSDELENVLEENFNPEDPDSVWCSDITYIWTFFGFVYLTSIMDLYSRKIISWVLSDTLEAKWVTEAVYKARKVRKVNKPLVIHTDRGIQYVCRRANPQERLQHFATGAKGASAA